MSPPGAYHIDAGQSYRQNSIHYSNKAVRFCRYIYPQGPEEGYFKTIRLISSNPHIKSNLGHLLVVMGNRIQVTCKEGEMSKHHSSGYGNTAMIRRLLKQQSNNLLDILLLLSLVAPTISSTRNCFTSDTFLS